MDSHLASGESTFSPNICEFSVAHTRPDVSEYFDVCEKDEWMEYRNECSREMWKAKVVFIQLEI